MLSVLSIKSLLRSSNRQIKSVAESDTREGRGTRAHICDAITCVHVMYVAYMASPSEVNSKSVVVG